MRLHAQTATIENGFVWLPREAPWLAEYLRELTLFPAGRHDDQVELDRPGARLDQKPPARARNGGALAQDGGGGGRGRRVGAVRLNPQRGKASPARKGGVANR